MKNIIVIGVAAAIPLAVQASSGFMKQPQSLKSTDGLSCIIYDDLTVFDLKALEDPLGYYSNGFYFNLCNRFNITDAETGKPTQTYVYKRSDESSIDKPEGTAYTLNQYADKALSVEETESEPRHVSITFTSQAMCDKGGLIQNDRFWQTNFEIFCDPEGSMKTELKSAQFSIVQNEDLCTLKISARHRAGCPIVEATSFIKWLGNNPFLAGIILISFGIIANFFGGYFFNYILTVAGGLSVFFVTILILSAFGGLKSMDSAAYAGHFGYILLAILCFTVAIAAGSGVAFVVFRFKRFGIALFGVFVGFICGFYLHKLLIAWITSNQIAKLIVIASSAIATGIYSFQYSETLTVPTTAIIGSYMIIRGFSMFAGGFPYEGLGLSDDDTQFHMENSYFYYLMAYLILLCGGVVFQRYKKYHLIASDQFAILMAAEKDSDYMRGCMMH